MLSPAIGSCDASRSCLCLVKREHALPLEGSSKAAHPPPSSLVNGERTGVTEPETAALITVSRYRDGAPTDREIIHTRREIVSRSCAVVKECGGVIGTGRIQAIGVSGRLPEGLVRVAGAFTRVPIEFGRSGAFPAKLEGRPQLARHGPSCGATEKRQVPVEPGLTASWRNFRLRGTCNP